MPMQQNSKFPRRASYGHSNVHLMLLVRLFQLKECILKKKTIGNLSAPLRFSFILISDTYGVITDLRGYCCTFNNI